MFLRALLILKICLPEDDIKFEILLLPMGTITCCYELRSLGLDNRTTLVLSNTRELDRVPNIK